MLLSCPGFIIGVIFAIFHLFGKHPPKHWLCIAVSSSANKLNVRRYIPPVIPSIPGAFLSLKLTIVCVISSRENSTSSLVFIGSSINFCMFLWCCVSSSSLSSRKCYSSITFIVS